MGMITAVRAAAAMGTSRATVRVMACRSPPRHSRMKPLRAVQKPSDTQAKRMVERVRMATSSGSLP